MNRRGFLGMVSALPAVPVALKAEESKPPDSGWHQVRPSNHPPIVAKREPVRGYFIPVYNIDVRGASEAFTEKFGEELAAVLDEGKRRYIRDYMEMVYGHGDYDIVGQLSDGRTVRIQR